MVIDVDFPEEEIRAILKDYALRGAKDFRRLPDDLRRKAQRRFENKLMLDDKKIGHAMSRLGSDPIDAFLAAPIGEDKGFRFAFFQPRLKKIDAARYTLSLVVAFWVAKGDKIFAVRLEPPGEEKDDAHGYAHLQFTRQIKLKDDPEKILTTDQESWLPISYPAFALGYRQPFHFFAGLAMSIHGFCIDSPTKYAAEILVDALSVTSARRSRKVLLEMNRLFG